MGERAVYPDVGVTHYLALNIRMAAVVQLIHYVYHSYRCAVIMCVCAPAVHSTVWYRSVGHVCTGYHLDI